MEPTAQIVERPGKYPPLRPLTSDEQKLVLDNIGLANEFANRKAKSFCFNYGRPGNWQLQQQFFEEFIGWACIGLCIAAQHYDPHHESEAKFSTFAVWKIRGQLAYATVIADIRAGYKWLSAPAKRLKEPKVKTFGSFQSTIAQNASGWTKNFDVPDTRAQHEPEELEPLHPELLVLMQLALDERRFRFVRQHILEGRSLLDIGGDEGISKERVRQIVESGLAKLRRNKAFMCALEKQRERRRQERNHDDLFDVKLIA